MSGGLSISLRPVDYLPEISDSCSSTKQLKALGVSEIISTLFGGIIGLTAGSTSPHPGRSLLLSSAVGMFGGLGISWKLHTNCVEQIEITQQLSKQVAERLDINKAALECHVPSRTCFVNNSNCEQVPNQMTLKGVTAVRAILYSEQWVKQRKKIEKELNYSTLIKIKEVDTLPPKESFSFLTQNVINTSTTFWMYLAFPIALASAPLMCLHKFSEIWAKEGMGSSRGIEKNPIEPALNLVGYSLLTAAGISLLAGTSILVYNSQNLKDVQLTNSKLMEAVAKQTNVLPKTIQCDGIHKTCHILTSTKSSTKKEKFFLLVNRALHLQAPQEIPKEIAITGPFAKKLDRLHDYFKEI